MTRPFLHRCAINLFLCMLNRISREPFDMKKGVQTSKVIHEIGSSSGMGVLLTTCKLKVSSSNSNVNMAPGGVHVPTIK